MHIAIIVNQLDATKMLISYGATLDLEETIYFEIPLHKAAKNKNVPIMKELIEHGAKITAKV